MMPRSAAVYLHSLRHLLEKKEHAVGETTYNKDRRHPVARLLKHPATKGKHYCRPNYSYKLPCFTQALAPLANPHCGFARSILYSTRPIATSLSGAFKMLLAHFVFVAL